MRSGHIPTDSSRFDARSASGRRPEHVGGPRRPKAAAPSFARVRRVKQGAIKSEANEKPTESSEDSSFPGSLAPPAQVFLSFCFPALPKGNEIVSEEYPGTNTIAPVRVPDDPGITSHKLKCAKQQAHIYSYQLDLLVIMRQGRTTPSTNLDVQNN